MFFQTTFSKINCSYLNSQEDTDFSLDFSSVIYETKDPPKLYCELESQTKVRFLKFYQPTHLLYFTLNNILFCISALQRFLHP